MERINKTDNPYYEGIEISNNDARSTRFDDGNPTNDTMIRQESDSLLEINTDTFQRISILENPYYCDITQLQNENVSIIISEPEDEAKKLEICGRIESEDTLVDVDTDTVHMRTPVETMKDCIESDGLENQLNVHPEGDAKTDEKSGSRNSSIYTLFDGVVLNLEAGEVQFTKNNSAC